jgi:hypothetical protein
MHSSPLGRDTNEGVMVRVIVSIQRHFQQYFSYYCISAIWMQSIWVYIIKFVAKNQSHPVTGAMDVNLDCCRKSWTHIE